MKILTICSLLLLTTTSFADVLEKNQYKDFELASSSAGECSKVITISRDDLGSPTIFLNELRNDVIFQRWFKKEISINSESLKVESGGTTILIAGKTAVIAEFDTKKILTKNCLYHEIVPADDSSIF